jgi:hypothetical protein
MRYLHASEAYNDAGEMSEVKMLKGTETLASLVYARDNDGHVKTATSKGLPGEEKPSYEYDANSRRSCPRIWILGAIDGYDSRACIASRSWGATALLWLCAVVVAGCGSARQAHIPAIPAVRTAGENPAAVRVNLPAGWTYHDSAVAHWGANTWCAVVTPAPCQGSSEFLRVAHENSPLGCVCNRLCFRVF